MNIRLASLSLALVCATHSNGLAGPLSAAETGARHGQALSAARICPGARTTAKAEALAAGFSGADAETFQAESAKIIAAWASAFACTDVDPAEKPREINGCRKAKILSCTTTWQEIGPDGTALPGLLEFKVDDPAPP